MKKLNISQISAHKHAEPSTPRELLEAILAGCDLEEDDIAASQIDDAAQDLLAGDESIEELRDYNDQDTNFYRLGHEICGYVVAVGVLYCGSIEEHAASAVEDFRTHLAEQDDDDLSAGSSVRAM
ncbi:hypothetical protein [Sulfitobacter delicatus]|uniref:Uncharacterized protein n=1 Tax=Sulfitobacter delicatus TaxID=218672 RepID=A0A1G7XH90_9RHOB|nr:hypothetical protein [Sulfitobacter delicatus]SDG83514.1 hypothetical protein SAMN04489759_112112 [Sulfitobacter delicatus]